MAIDNLFNHISRMDLLRTFGLAPRPRDYFLPALGLFSTGVLVGAGIGLLLAPKAGSKLRKDLSDELRSRLEELSDGLEHLATKLRHDILSEEQAEEQAEAEPGEAQEPEGMASEQAA